MMGACVSIYFKEQLTDTAKYCIDQMSSNLNKATSAFTVKYKKPNLKLLESLQYRKILGAFPKEELYICGFMEPLFIACSAIMKKYGGLLDIGSSSSLDEDKINIEKGKVFRVISYSRYGWNFYIERYYLLDYQFVDWHYNENADDLISHICNLDYYNSSNS